MERIAYKGGMADAFDKEQVVVGEVEVRLARPDERRCWDALMDATNWVRVGLTKGFARHNGAYTDPRAVPNGSPPALAAGGKRLRGANRHTDDGVYFETVTTAREGPRAP